MNLMSYISPANKNKSRKYNAFLSYHETATSLMDEEELNDSSTYMVASIILQHTGKSFLKLLVFLFEFFATPA